MRVNLRAADHDVAVYAMRVAIRDVEDTMRIFTCYRPVWFRPSAIAVGWVLGQFTYQYLTTGTLSDGICTDGTIAWRC